LVVGLIAVLLAPSLGRMSFSVWFGAIATGLCFAFVALGVFITFRVLDYPDLTIDGSFPLGAAISASMIVAGVGAYLTLPFAVLGGALAGVATGLIATRLRISSLLASILTTTALISVNLRIMGRSNIPLLNSDTIFTPFTLAFRGVMLSIGGEQLARLSKNLLVIIMVGVFVLIVKLLFDRFMHTEVGLAMRATGDNPQMIRSLGTNTDKMLIMGLAISNGLVALSGAIFAQYQGFADVNMGYGLIIAGLAAVILGETFFRPRHIAGASLAVIVGMIVYRIAIAAALSISIPLPSEGTFRIDPQDVKLATALLVLVALWFTRSRGKKR
jgi:putative ABC transport system permease protein